MLRDAEDQGWAELWDAPGALGCSRVLQAGEHPGPEEAAKISGLAELLWFLCPFLGLYGVALVSPFER